MRLRREPAEFNRPITEWGWVNGLGLHCRKASGEGSAGSSASSKSEDSSGISPGIAAAIAIGAVIAVALLALLCKPKPAQSRYPHPLDCWLRRGQLELHICLLDVVEGGDIGDLRGGDAVARVVGSKRG